MSSVTEAVLDNKKLEKSENLFPVVGVGASAGGIEVFKTFIRTIPADSGMAFILIQHLHPKQESLLPEILQKESKIPVTEIQDNIPVRPNHIYVIPANKLLIATDGILKLGNRPPVKTVNRTIDIFFASLAEVHRRFSIGVIFSGRGEDGAQGLREIKKQGGVTIAQDPDSAAYEDMPKSAIKAHAADFILPPEQIMNELLRLKSFNTLTPHEAAEEEKITEEYFEQIYALLLIRKDVDFTFYKQSTIRRRILRRMSILKLDHIADYLDYLKRHKAEQDTLFQDMLIPVTEFFRDPKAFEILNDSVYPKLLAGKSLTHPLRIWVAGCATGQEVYSLAISLLEYLGERADKVKIQIFATDISEKSIAKARAGIYLKKEVKGVSEERLKQYFYQLDGNYQIRKSVRDLCIFAEHNFLKNPPFAKLDLISCRNVLIYMNPFLQKKAFSIFHYALNQNGYLLLGKSETVLNAAELFFTQDKKNKIFVRKQSTEKFATLSGKYSEAAFSSRPGLRRSKEGRVNDFQRNAEQVLLAKYTPPGLIINDHHDIVQFRGAIGPFLESSTGKASLNVLKMVRQELSFELRNALHKVKTTHESYLRKEIPMQRGERLITLEVVPLMETIEPYFLILFREGIPPIDAVEKNKPPDKRDLRIRQLETELQRLREDIHHITEDQESVHEELQSANEELLSDSEELQSLNEELETSTEELQSTNEELMTVNLELFERNSQLEKARQFSDTIIATLHEPLVILDRKFRIREVNQAFFKVFQIKDRNCLGKVLFELQDHSWEIPDLRDALNEIARGRKKMIDKEIDWNFPEIGKRAICVNLQRIRLEAGDPLILLAMEDFTERKHVEKANAILNERRNLYQFFNQVPACFCILKGPQLIFELANPAFCRFIGDRHPVGLSIREAIPELEGQGFIEALEHVYQTGESEGGQEQVIFIRQPNGEVKKSIININYQTVLDVHEQIEGILVFIYDITEQAAARRKLEESEKKFRHIANNISSFVWVADKEGYRNFFNKSWQLYTGRAPFLDEGMGWTELVHPDDLNAFLEQYRSGIQEQKSFEMEYRLRRHDGRYRWILCRVSIVINLDGKFTGLLGTCIDIHEQKIKEQKKDEFIGIASHEMKTPLTSAKAYLQLVEQSLRPENEQAAEYIGKASQAVNRLSDLISELLDVSKIQHGKMSYNLRKFDFNEIVDAAIESVQYSAAKHTIIKSGTVSRPVRGDQERLKQVLINLLSNAIKYSPDATKVWVQIVEKPELLEVSVKDEGIGISPQNVKRIFERYYRVADHSLQFHGLGIGLYIANEIIRRHQGRLWVESEKEQGSTFFFAIPFDPADELLKV